MPWLSACSNGLATNRAGRTWTQVVGALANRLTGYRSVGNRWTLDTVGLQGANRPSQALFTLGDSNESTVYLSSQRVLWKGVGYKFKGTEKETEHRSSSIIWILKNRASVCWFVTANEIGQLVKAPWLLLTLSWSIVSMHGCIYTIVDPCDWLGLKARFYHWLPCIPTC